MYIYIYIRIYIYIYIYIYTVNIYIYIYITVIKALSDTLLHFGFGLRQRPGKRIRQLSESCCSSPLSDGDQLCQRLRSPVPRPCFADYHPTTSRKYHLKARNAPSTCECHSAVCAPGPFFSSTCDIDAWPRSCGGLCGCFAGLQKPRIADVDPDTKPESEAGVPHSRTQNRPLFPVFVRVQVRSCYSWVYNLQFQVWKVKVPLLQWMPSRAQPPCALSRCCRREGPSPMRAGLL